jgi:hypothetical protein
MSLYSFLVEWFRGPTGVEEWAGGMLRELGWCLGAMKRCTFYRESIEYAGLALWIERVIDGVLSAKSRASYSTDRLFLENVNLFMGIGFWVDFSRLEPEQSVMLYDRVCYDFDSEDPGTAVEVALSFAKSIESSYGATPIVFLSGFKGAHVVVPLEKPTDWEGYKLLWNHFLGLLPKDYRSFVDRNMLQWNRLDRVPLTWNIKEVDGVVKKAFAKIIYPEEFTWETFRWSKLRGLDPSAVKVWKVVLPEQPKVVARLSTGSSSGGERYRWVEKVIESGLPDGRHRFILYVLSAYLMNVKQLSIEEAFQIAKRFVENSCRNFNNCSKVYDSFILGDLKRVKEKKLKPMSLKTLQQKDPELYNIIVKVLGSDPATNIDTGIKSGFRVPQELVDFVEETGLKEFSYEDFRRWLESKKSITASEWHHWERTLRKLAERCVLGRKFLVDGEWVDYGCGPVKQPPSKEVKFYVARDSTAMFLII